MNTAFNKSLIYVLAAILTLAGLSSAAAQEPTQTPTIVPGQTSQDDDDGRNIEVTIEGPVQAIGVNTINIYNIEIEVNFNDDDDLQAVQIGDILRIEGIIDDDDFDDDNGDDDDDDDDDDNGDDDGDDGPRIVVVAINIQIITVQVNVQSGSPGGAQPAPGGGSGGGGGNVPPPSGGGGGDDDDDD